ncbi:54S ribosomal protein L39, mitochondrial [Cytospora mali]|uniref:Large ribosomal subunit protein bL33m n=1 Tax=Cytospora mali TaxID=578113 RepID=A0A194VEK8_CYTMA|nr:54S ribosomal protein L39, mitochondrial [Valsa mali var. pyri (nom. inval.)]
MAKKTKSRIVSVRLLSMALTGFFYQFTRPRTSPPMSMLKYDPIEAERKPINTAIAETSSGYDDDDDDVVVEDIKRCTKESITPLSVPWPSLIMECP